MIHIPYKNHILNNILFYSSCLTAFMPLIPARGQVFVFIFLGVSAVIDQKVNNSSAKSTALKIVIILPSIFYLLHISSIFYSEDLKEALFVVEKKASLLAIPFILFISKSRFSKKQVNVLLVIFTFSCVLLSLFLLSRVEFYNVRLKANDVGLLQAVTNIRHELADLSGVHPTYLSVYFLFSCLIFSLFLLTQKLNKALKSLLISGYLILLFVSILLASRMPLIAFLFIQVLIVTFSQAISLNAKLISISFIAITMILGLAYIPSFKYRIKEMFSTELKPPIKAHYNSTNLRIGIMLCSIEVIKNNWFLGVGIGDSQHELNKCLYEFETTAYNKTDYNSHNEYFSIWIDSGIVPFIIFILFIGSLFYFANRTKNQYFMSLILLISLCMLTEDLLSRQAGILFFMFFYFVFCNIIEKKDLDSFKTNN